MSDVALVDAPADDDEPPDDAPHHTGAMVALVPADAAALVVEGGDPPEQLHVTLRFLGDAADIDAGTRAAILSAIESVAGLGPAIDVTASGLVIMGADDAGQPAVALLVQSDDVVSVHDLVGDALEGIEIPEESYPCFIPHLTLGYGLDATAADVVAMASADIRFDRLLVTFADERTEFPLSTPEAATMPALLTVHPRVTAAADGEGDPAAVPADTAPTPAEAATGDVGASFPFEDAPVVFANVDMTEPDAVTGALGAVESFDLTASVPGDGTVTLTGPGLADLRAALKSAAPTTWDAPDDSITVDLADGAPIADGDTVSVNAVTLTAADGPVDISLLPPDGDEAELPMGLSDAPEAFTALLVPEGTESGDGRLINAGALTWRNPPLPLMVMFENPTGGEGHDGAEICGRIDRVYRVGDDVMADGVYDLSIPAGVKAMAMRDQGQIRGISVDLDMVTIEYENELPADAGLEDLFDFDPGVMIVTAGRVMGATQCPFPAFQESQILPTAEPAIAASGHAPKAYGLATCRVWTPVQLTNGVLVASGGRSYPVNPPLAWLERPSLTDDDYQALRADPNCAIVTAAGRYLAYLGTWDSCHIGFDGRCVSMPRSNTGYRGYRSGSVLSAEGTAVTTGVVVLDTVHPDLALSASDAQAFYAHSGSAVADVAPYEDDMGVLLVGSLRPGVTGAQVRTLRASRTSGDWRNFQGKPRELVAVLVVNLAGFRSMTPALVASGAMDGAGVRPRRAGAFAYRVVDNELDALVAVGSAPSPGAARLDALERKVAALTRSTMPIRAEFTKRRWHAARTPA